MTVAFMIYLYTVVGSITKLIIPLSLVVGLGYAATTICYLNDEETEARKFRAWSNKLLPYWIGLFLVCCLVPNKDDIKFIIGGTVAYHGADYLVNNEEAQQLPANLLEAANDFLADMKEEKTDDK